MEVRDSRTSHHSAHAQSQVWQIWLALVSIYCVYKSIQNQNVVGPGQRSRFLVLTKRSAASGDENDKVMNTLQAHGTTTHKLTQNTAGQSQPQDSHGHITAATAMAHTNAKQMLIHGQDIGQRLQRRPLTRLPPGHNSVHWQTISKRCITHQTLADGQNTNTTCKRKCYWPDKLLVVNYAKFHLTISNIGINII